MKKQIRKDAREIVNRYTLTHDLQPKSIKVKSQKHMWGSCTKDGVINLNWQLIFAPKAVLEYAILHELCHLKYRTHDKKFWSFLARIMPDYQTRKTWLEKNEQAMFLQAV